MSDPLSPPLILASGSETRARLLKDAGVPFIVQRPLVDEDAARDALAAEGSNARDAATALAELKAAQVARTMPPDVWVLGADQILDTGEGWLAKGESMEAVRQQLSMLRGRSHKLCSAAVLYRGDQRIWHAAETATLHMRDFSDAWLDRYLAAEGEALLSSVGGYRLEGLGSQLMTRVEGPYFAVLGLPLLPLLQALRDQGILER